MRIDEGECRVRRERDALTRRRQPGDRSRCGAFNGARAGKDGVEIDVPFGHVCQALKMRLQVAVLARLYESQMPFRQNDAFFARQSADDANAELRDRIGDQAAMALAADAIEDHARDGDVGIVRGESAHHSRGGLRLRAHVKHQKHRHGKTRGEIGGRASAPARSRHPVEQPHDAFDHQELAIAHAFGDQRVDEGRRHRPSVEVESLCSGGGGVKRGVDIVGTGFRRLDRDALALERREQAERDGRLAGAGIRRCDDEPARRHDAASLGT